MKVMKKLLIALLCAGFAVSSFAGCGGGGSTTSSAPAESSAPAANESSAPAAEGGDTAEPAADEGSADVNEDGTVNNPEAVKVDENKLVFWSLFSGGDGAWMDKIISAYNETSPSMQVQSVMLVWADYYTKLGTAIAANKGPDVGVSHISKLPELVEQGMVIPIDDFAATSGTDWANFTDSMNEGVSFDGAHYAMPLDTHAEIMYFNKDILEKSGVTINANNQLDITSVDQFKQIMDAVKPNLEEGSSCLSLPQKGDDPYRAWWATYYQMGGPALINEANDAVTMDKDIAVQAADFIKSLWDDGYVMAGIEDHQKYFQGGQSALFFGGTWATGVFESTDGFNFGAQPFPQLFQNSSCWADAHTMIIPTNKRRDDSRTQASVDFINWVSAEGALTWAGSGQIPSNMKVQESAEYKALAYRPSYVEAAKTAVLPSKNPHFYAMKDAMIKNLDTIWTGQASSADAINNIFDELNSNLG